MKHKRNEKGFHHVFLLMFIVVLGVVGFTGWEVAKNHKSTTQNSQTSNNATANSASASAIAAGKMLSNNYCRGSGDATFTHLPMNAADFNLLIPYGLTVGGHVTPIDHQYFQPTVFQSPRDTYPVFAMADATLADIQSRYTPNHGTDYRLVFAHSCTFLYYYDLLTSLTPKFKAAFDNKQFNFPVTAGEQIGAIGGQTLDFAVWNTTKILTGFVNPASYDGEAWKIYTADPFPYFTPQLRAIVQSKDPRVAAPIAGKIDYDQDGKLIGNWFVQGTGGYHDFKLNPQANGNYWVTHFSIAPNEYDPSRFIISLGDFNGQADQFLAQGNTPDPATVSQSTGLVKYTLVKFNFVKADGSRWDQLEYTPAPKLVEDTTTNGCLLVQLTGQRTLKLQSFPNKSCSAISGFDSSAKIYTR